MSALIPVLLTGCSLFQKKPISQSQAAASDLYAAASYDRPVEADAYDSYSADSLEGTSDTGYRTAASAYPRATAAEQPTASLAATTSASPRYHTVAKHDTLYGLARLYYNDASRWKDIYEANRGAGDEFSGYLVEHPAGKGCRGGKEFQNNVISRRGNIPARGRVIQG